MHVWEGVIGLEVINQRLVLGFILEVVWGPKGLTQPHIGEGVGVGGVFC